MGNYTPNPFMTQPAHLPPLALSQSRDEIEKKERELIYLDVAG